MVSFYWSSAPHDLLQNSTNISDSIFGKSSILLPSFIIAGHCGQNKKDVVIFELALPNQPDQPDPPLTRFFDPEGQPSKKAVSTYVASTIYNCKRTGWWCCWTVCIFRIFVFYETVIILLGPRTCCCNREKNELWFSNLINWFGD